MEWNTATSACVGYDTQPRLAQTRGDDHGGALRHAFREAILEDVVKGGIVDDSGLRRLFDRWVQVNPVQNRSALAQAIQDVQVRLDKPL